MGSVIDTAHLSIKQCDVICGVIPGKLLSPLHLPEATVLGKQTRSDIKMFDQMGFKFNKMYCFDKAPPLDAP